MIMNKSGDNYPTLYVEKYFSESDLNAGGEMLVNIGSGRYFKKEINNG